MFATIDEENDRVSISTDEELFSAVSGLQSTVLKLYLRKKSSEKTPSRTVAHHPNVVCDGCEMRITGTRYKCLSCPDFDLCSGIMAR